MWIPPSRQSRACAHLKAALEEAGMKVGLIGTTGNMIGTEYLQGNMTTPEAHHLQALLYRMRQENVQAVVMEVSAHAIDMHRIDGIMFDVGCYTNLSQDHLDYFFTMDRYFEAKRRFFDSRYIRRAAVNVDDERAGRILAGLSMPCLRYGISTNADLYARDIEISENGVTERMPYRMMPWYWMALLIAARGDGPFRRCRREKMPEYIIGKLFACSFPLNVHVFYVLTDRSLP